MNVLLIFLILWSFGDAKNIFDQIPGGDLECDESANLNGQGRVGGPDACQVKPHSKPWAVNLRGCGGTLIGKRVVLTAAHCICKCDDFLGICQPAAKCDQWTRNRYVVVGEHDTLKYEKGDQKIEIKNAFAHKDWTGDDPMNLFDVALIFLKEDAILNENVQLASLPQSNQDCPPGNSLTLSGWGKDPYQEEDHHILWAVKQECLNVGECDRFDSLKDKDLVLCVGDKRDPRNSGYRGDSGGPLTYTDDSGETTVYGIVSGPGNKHGRPMTTAAFARVSHPRIIEWIRNTTNSYVK